MATIEFSILNFMCHSAILIYRDQLLHSYEARQKYKEFASEIHEYLHDTYKFDVIFPYLMNFVKFDEPLEWIEDLAE